MSEMFTKLNQIAVEVSGVLVMTVKIKNSRKRRKDCEHFVMNGLDEQLLNVSNLGMKFRCRHCSCLLRKTQFSFSEFQIFEE